MCNIMNKSKWLYMAVSCVWLFISLYTTALAQEFLEDPLYIEPTLSENAIQYDAENPLNLHSSQLIAQSAILVNGKTGEVLFEKNADMIIYPASTTKIMTVMLGIMLGNMDTTCIYSEKAANLPVDSSMIGLEVGETIQMKDLLYATMLRSGNDGASMIAEAITGDLPSFTEFMNQMAKTLGCTGTHFANAHGYHDDSHYSTVRDMAKITCSAMGNELFKEIVSIVSYKLPSSNMNASRVLLNTAEQILNEDLEGNDFYYPYATGVKTGYHARAGYCFVGSAEKDGVELVSVVFYTSKSGRWTDTTKLMDYGFALMESR